MGQAARRWGGWRLDPQMQCPGGCGFPCPGFLGWTHRRPAGTEQSPPVVASVGGKGPCCGWNQPPGAAPYGQGVFSLVRLQITVYRFSHREGLLKARPS